MNQLQTIPKMGDTSPDVTLLQVALNNKNFPCQIDGIFYKGTLAAVKKAQVANKTAGTGKIGPQTLAFLGLSVVAITPATGQKTITQKLPGTGRHLHPVMRVSLEKKLFPNGQVPVLWMTKRYGSDIGDLAILVAKAVAGLGIHEQGGNNKGQGVGEVQYTVDINALNHGLGNGDAWCEDTAEIIPAFIEDFFQIPSPLLASQSTQAVANAALRIKGLTTQVPTPGAQAIGQHAHAPTTGHAMFCIAVDLKTGTMTTVEGNTSISNISDGDACGIKTRRIWVNGDIKTRTFAFVYPDNLLPARTA